MKIAIISHTSHYKDSNGKILGWGPTVSEINFLSLHFEKIYHLAYFIDSPPPPSALSYTNDSVEFIPLPVSGGKKLIDKLGIISNLPETISIVNRILKCVDAFQLRTPTGIGVYLIPYLTYFQKSKKGWYKYAGNWNQENAPLGYAMQRSLLQKQPRIVTINGSWKNQPANCLTFENPCITEGERMEGLKIIEGKIYKAPYSFCFVGRLEDEKGVQRIIDALGNLPDKSLIDTIHFIGDGIKRVIYETQAKRLDLTIKFHGFLSRESVFDIYRKCHFLLLPSTASEGFPKVIAEGMNFGCIPIVSSVSSIGQYINIENGYIVEPTNAQTLLRTLLTISLEENMVLINKAKRGYDVAEKFTFKRYLNRILNEILIK